MIKIVSVLFVVLAVICLAGCGDDDVVVNVASSQGSSSATAGNSSSSIASSSSATSGFSSSSSSSIPVYTLEEVKTMVSVPGGIYTQHTTDGGSFSHTISGFRLGKYEVVYELWYMVYQWAIANGYFFANAGREGNDGTDGASPTARKYEPVTTINWRDMIVWCNAYSQMDGKTPVYCSDSGFTTPIKDSRDGSYNLIVNTTAGSFDNPYVNWDATGYRLPTEGEWQYAASYKDGISWTPYNYASGATAAWTDATATGQVAWVARTTKTVGTKGANALGIYDMSGNVWEWCWDRWGALPTTAQTDYRGPASGSSRIRKGGCYSNPVEYMQVGIRGGNLPHTGDYLLGFRLASKQ